MASVEFIGGGRCGSVLAAAFAPTDAPAVTRGRLPPSVNSPDDAGDGAVPTARLNVMTTDVAGLVFR